MEHEIELTTTEALLIIEALRSHESIYRTDKELADRLSNGILKVVRHDLKEDQHGIDKNS